MKKIFVLFSSVALLSLVACGGSDEAKKLQEKKTADSLQVIHHDDSVRQAEQDKQAQDLMSAPDTSKADTSMNHQ